MNLRHIWQSWSVFLPIFGRFEVSTCVYCMRRVEGVLSAEDTYEVCPTLYRWSLPAPGVPPTLPPGNLPIPR